MCRFLFFMPITFTMLLVRIYKQLDNIRILYNNKISIVHVLLDSGLGAITNHPMTSHPNNNCLMAGRYARPSVAIF